MKLCIKYEGKHTSISMTTVYTLYQKLCDYTVHRAKDIRTRNRREPQIKMAEIKCLVVIGHFVSHDQLGWYVVKGGHHQFNKHTYPLQHWDGEVSRVNRCVGEEKSAGTWRSRPISTKRQTGKCWC